MQKSGKIAGFQENYEVSADGKYKIFDGKTTREGQLEGDDLKTVTDAVIAVDWAALPRRKVDSKALVCRSAVESPQVRS